MFNSDDKQSDIDGVSVEGRRVLVECLSRRGLPFHHSRRFNFAVELRVVLTLANRRLRAERIIARALRVPRRIDNAKKGLTKRSPLQKGGFATCPP